MNKLINMKIRIYITILVAIMASGLIWANIPLFQNDTQLVLGTWISENDSKSVWVFETNNICKRYYNNELRATYSFSISQSSPQCGQQVDQSGLHTYLSLTKSSDNEQTCYFINGLTTQKLSINAFDRSQILVFNKKP